MRRKYHSVEEFNVAARARAARYYAINKDRIKNRRLERKEKLYPKPQPSPLYPPTSSIAHSCPSPSPSSATSECEDSPSPCDAPSPSTNSLDASSQNLEHEIWPLLRIPNPYIAVAPFSESDEVFDGCIPTILAEDLKRARRGAPIPSRVEDSCYHWQLAFAGFLRGGSILNIVYRDLLRTSNRDKQKFREYIMLEVNLVWTEDAVHEAIRHAKDNDPSERSRACQVSRGLGRLARHLTVAIRELILFRRDGVKALSDAAHTGALKFNLV
ncbi:hypothetical protein SCHPADRAFT_947868 [Schizopora paradoxa]|uniref:Uncharacterized protein n=1 Tax=Schizopora paradoxa TaxID=27342 RepID=A0A0H2R411_9AGAM|nr:hypothetical protein SCHPADRAFT_947868 [Schizopora paradoxa]